MPASPAWLSTARCPLAERAQKTLFIFFQNKAGQAASGIGASVNSDPIGANLGSHCRRVTVHHQFAMLRRARQERFANIDKIITMLAIERHARSYSSMAKEVI